MGNLAAQGVTTHTLSGHVLMPAKAFTCATALPNWTLMGNEAMATNELRPVWGGAGWGTHASPQPQCGHRQMCGQATQPMMSGVIWAPPGVTTHTHSSGTQRHGLIHPYNNTRSTARGVGGVGRSGNNHKIQKDSAAKPRRQTSIQRTTTASTAHAPNGAQQQKVLPQERPRSRPQTLRPTEPRATGSDRARNHAK